MQNNPIWRVSDYSLDELVKIRKHTDIVNDIWTCINPMRNGSLEILKYVHEIGYIYPQSSDERNSCIICVQKEKKIADYTAQNIVLFLLENLDFKHIDNSTFKYSTGYTILTIDEYMRELAAAFNYTCAKYDQNTHHFYDIFNTLQLGHFRDIKKIIIDYTHPHLAWADCVANLILERLFVPSPRTHDDTANLLPADILIEMITQMPLCEKFVCNECLLKQKIWCNICSEHMCILHECEFDKCTLVHTKDEYGQIISMNHNNTYGIEILVQNVDVIIQGIYRGCTSALKYVNIVRNTISNTIDYLEHYH